MNDEPKKSEPQAAKPVEPVAAPTEEVEQGKAFAILSYALNFVGCLFCCSY